MSEKLDRNKCWLCLRLEPKRILKDAHSIWAVPKKAREVAQEAMQLISKSYAENPLVWTGKSYKVIVSGLFYLLGFRHNSPRTQQRISEALGLYSMQSSSIRESYRRWLDHHPSWFPEFGYEERATPKEYGESKALTFKGSLAQLALRHQERYKGYWVWSVMPEKIKSELALKGDYEVEWEVLDKEKKEVRIRFYEVPSSN